MSPTQYGLVLLLLYFLLAALYAQVRHGHLPYPRTVKGVLLLCFLGWIALLFDFIQGVMMRVILRS